MDIVLDELLRRHYVLIPVGRDKKPLIQSWKPYQTRRPTEQEIDQWRSINSPAWAAVTGQTSGIVTADFDGDAGIQTMRRLGVNPHRRTGSGGFHADFYYPGWRVPSITGKAKLEVGTQYPGVDIRADGGLVIMLGSNTNGPYEWLREPTPDSLDLLPNDFRKLVGLLHPPSDAPVPSSLDPACAPSGSDSPPQNSR